MIKLPSGAYASCMTAFRKVAISKIAPTRFVINRLASLRLAPAGLAWANSIFLGQTKAYSTYEGRLSSAGGLRSVYLPVVLGTP